MDILSKLRYQLDHNRGIGTSTQADVHLAHLCGVFKHIVGLPGTRCVATHTVTPSLMHEMVCPHDEDNICTGSDIDSSP